MHLHFAQERLVVVMQQTIRDSIITNLTRIGTKWVPVTEEAPAGFEYHYPSADDIRRNGGREKRAA